MSFPSGKERPELTMLYNYLNVQLKCTLADMDWCEMQEPEEQVFKSTNDVGRMKLQAGWGKQNILCDLSPLKQGLF